jgi:hypothetical protein
MQIGFTREKLAVHIKWGGVGWGGVGWGGINVSEGEEHKCFGSGPLSRLLNLRNNEILLSAGTKPQLWNIILPNTYCTVRYKPYENYINN